MEKALKRLKELDRDIQYLSHIRSILGWDQETYMPEKAIDERSEQISLIETMIHAQSTSPETGELLAKCGISNEKSIAGQESAFFTLIDAAFLREVGRRYFKSLRLPASLVAEIARQTSLALPEWIQARKESNFGKFAPRLEILVKLIKEKAQCLGFSQNPYEPLFDEYEPWGNQEELDPLFESLKSGLKKLLDKIISSGKKIKTDFLLREYPVEKQVEFGHHVLSKMGFDHTRGRLDVSAHPFTTSLGASDVRLTTRYNKDFFNSGIFGIIHECGHGLYDLGYGGDLQGTLLAQGTSLGIHESQSRMWENIIGKSRVFWNAFYPALQQCFPDALSDVDCNSFYAAVNTVEPSHIRVEADEVTYNLHIILRYTLERGLFSGSLAVADLPGAWNAASEDLLGITPPDDASGVLQDIHWSMGAFGYFPTYTLGNLYSAQFYDRMKNDIPGLDVKIGNGELSAVLSWLREKIHSQGSVYPAAELCKKVTGRELKPEYYLAYLNDKFKLIYDFE